MLLAVIQAAGPADGEGGHAAISRSLFSSPTPNVMKCFSIGKRLWLGFSAVAIHGAANELPRGAGGPRSDVSIQPYMELWMESHNPGPSCPACPLDGEPGAEVAVLCEGQPQAEAGGQTASSQAEPAPATGAACTHGGLCALRSLKGSVFGLTVNEEITYSPEYLG